MRSRTCIIQVLAGGAVITQVSVYTQVILQSVSRVKTAGFAKHKTVVPIVHRQLTNKLFDWKQSMFAKSVFVRRRS